MYTWNVPPPSPFEISKYAIPSEEKVSPIRRVSSQNYGPWLWDGTRLIKSCTLLNLFTFKFTITSQRCGLIVQSVPLTYLALRSSGPWQTMGSKSSPPAPVGSRSPDAIPIDALVHQVLFECGPPSHCWTASSSATTTRGPWHGVIGWSFRWHPDDVACH